MSEMVNHPRHYNSGKIEVIEFLEDQQLEPHEWNVVKYVCRAKHKGRRIEDLEKAVWYLRRKIELLKAEAEGREPKRPNDMNHKTIGTLGVKIETELKGLNEFINRDSGKFTEVTPDPKFCAHCGHSYYSHIDMKEKPCLCDEGFDEGDMCGCNRYEPGV